MLVQARALILSTLLALPPLAAAAHPHVYIDSKLELIYDETGRLSAVAVEWSYDELYSLLIVTDLGLDPDGDGVLDDDERTRLQGFDADWEPDFDGRLYLTTDQGPVELLGPRSFEADYRDGRIVSRHLRPLSSPLPADAALQLQTYDPEFYVDFTLHGPPRILGRDDCRAALDQGNPDAARAAYRAALDAALLEATDDAEAELVTVDIGGAGAGALNVICGSATTG